MDITERIEKYLNEKEAPKCERCGRPMPETEWKVWKNKVCSPCVKEEMKRIRKKK